MAKAVAAEEPRTPVTPEDALQGLRLMAIPEPTYKAMSAAAEKRGMTLSQFMKNAIEGYLEKTEDAGSGTPRRLLTED
jgi:hypothetical protein